MTDENWNLNNKYLSFHIVQKDMEIVWQNVKFEYDTEAQLVPHFDVHEKKFSESQSHSNYATVHVMEIETDDTSQDQKSEFDDFIEFSPDEIIEEEVNDDEDVQNLQIRGYETRNDGTLYFCTTCTLDFPSLAYLKRHFNTKKHKRALAMEQRGRKVNQRRKYVRKNEAQGVPEQPKNLKTLTDLTQEEISLLHNFDEQISKIQLETSVKDFYENFNFDIDIDSAMEKNEQVLASPDEIFADLVSSSQEFLKGEIISNHVIPEQVKIKQEDVAYTVIQVMPKQVKIELEEVAIQAPFPLNDILQKPKHFCKWCNKVFNLRCHYTQHVNSVHSGNRNFKCQKCGKKYPLEDMLNRHMEKHVENKPFKCNKCERSYNNKVDLKRHEKTHQDVKDHICKLCGNGFVRYDHLQKHYAVHQKRMSLGLGDKIRKGRGLAIKNELF